MRKFEIACYYDRPILTAQLPAQFSAAQAGEADIAELEQERFSECFENPAILGA